MKKTMIQKIKEDSIQYGVPFWQLPDFLILTMAFINITGMIFTYYLALNFVDDPRTAVIFVALESAVILIIGNIIAESSRKVIVNYRLKEEFIDLISHQIRSPITNIKWNLELLNEEKTTSKQKIYTNRLADSTNNIVSLVNDFVYLSRLDQSKKELVFQKIDIKKTIKEILAELTIFANSKKIKFNFIDNSEMSYVKTDQKKIKIVINNVIENALKYSSEKSEVEIEIYNKKYNLIIRVKDSGCGIEKKAQPFVFDKFYRAMAAEKIAVDGTGVGLYISKTILKELDGRIWFESRKKKGSTFYMSLPAFY